MWLWETISFLVLAYFSWVILYFGMIALSGMNDFQKKFIAAAIAGLALFLYYSYKENRENYLE